MTAIGRRREASLFSEPARPSSYWTAHIDGGARGNPGPAGFGVVITDQDGHKIAGLSEYLGHQTNNFAEYSGLLAALEYCVQHGGKALKVISDSELMVRQVRGEYKVSNPVLKELHARAQFLIRQLDWFSIGHVLRESNREADRLANAAMDKGMGRTPRSSAPLTQERREFSGIVRNGTIQLLDGELPEGTRVDVRVKK
jgi:ribonuclease HI